MREKKGGAGVSGLIAIISSSTNCTKEPCFCFLFFFGGGLGILNIYEQTPGSKAFVFLTKKPLKCASSKQAKKKKKRPWISLWYVQEKLGGDLGSTQYSTAWCLCVPSGPGSVPHPYSIFQSAFISRALYNNGCVVHSIFMHIHKCTNSITASGHSKIPPHPPLNKPWMQTSPLDMMVPWNKKESPTGYNRDTTNHILPFCVIIFFLYKHVFNIFTHEKKCRIVAKTKSFLSAKKYCLSWSKNGNVGSQSLSQWLQWSLIYTLCQIN